MTTSVQNDRATDTLVIKFRRDGVAPWQRYAGPRVEASPGVFFSHDEAGQLSRIEISAASARITAESLERLAGTPSQEPEWLTLIEAGRYCDLSPTTLRVQIRNGKLRARKQGRDWLISRTEVDDYAERRYWRMQREFARDAAAVEAAAAETLRRSALG